MIALILILLSSLGLAEPSSPPPASIGSTIPRGGPMLCVPCAAWCLFEIPEAP